MLSERTRWVAVTAASNAVGTVPDLRGIVAAAHAAGARVYVDAVHAAPHRPLDLAALGCDALACSAYKWFGPHVGDPVRRAGAARGARARTSSRPSPDEAPDRWELGTLPFESLAGVRAAAEYMLALGWERGPRARGARCCERALDGLAAIDGVTLYGAAPDRAPTLMFTVAGPHLDRGRRPRSPSARSRSGTATTTPGSSSAASASPRTARVRAGFVHYNDDDDAERLVAAVADVATGAGPRAPAAASADDPPA